MSPRPTAGPLAGLEPPELPAELRAHVLEVAAEALSRGPEAGLWTVIWHSRTARLAWGVSVIVLLAGHLALSVPQGPRRQSAGSLMARDGRTAGPELCEAVCLPRIRINARSWAGAQVVPSHASTTVDTPPEGSNLS